LLRPPAYNNSLDRSGNAFDWRMISTEIDNVYTRRDLTQMQLPYHVIYDVTLVFAVVLPLLLSTGENAFLYAIVSSINS